MREGKPVFFRENSKEGFKDFKFQIPDFRQKRAFNFNKQAALVWNLESEIWNLKSEI